MNNGIPSGALIGQNLIKQNRLRDITNAAFAGSNSNKVNIYIDLSNILSPLLSESFNPDAMLHENEIAANVINMIMHYRTFYWKYYKVATEFHLVWSTNCPTVAQMFYANYNLAYINNRKYSGHKIDIIIANMVVLQEVLQYIPDCSLTLGTFETGVIMSYIMRHNQDPHPNIIITKDIMTMQAACNNPNTVIFRPVKKSGEDESIFINPHGNGIIDYLCDLRKTKRPDLIRVISPKLIGAILAMTRVPERGVKSLLNLSTALQAIDAAICKDSLLNDYNSNCITVAQALESNIATKLLSGSINDRFKAIDQEYQLICFNNNPERLNYIGCMNKSNEQELHKLLTEKFHGIELKI